MFEDNAIDGKLLFESVRVRMFPSLSGGGIVPDLGLGVLQVVQLLVRQDTFVPVLTARKKRLLGISQQ